MISVSAPAEILSLTSSLWVITTPALLLYGGWWPGPCLALSLGEGPKKIQNFGHMSEVGLTYLPSTLVWTKISLDEYSSVYSTYLSKKFGHFGIKVCSWIHIYVEYTKVLT